MDHATVGGVTVGGAIITRRLCDINGMVPSRSRAINTFLSTGTAGPDYTEFPRVRHVAAAVTSGRYSRRRIDASFHSTFVRRQQLI